jgi:hypothetical protein
MNRLVKKRKLSKKRSKEPLPKNRRTKKITKSNLDQQTPELKEKEATADSKVVIINEREANPEYSKNQKKPEYFSTIVRKKRQEEKSNVQVSIYKNIFLAVLMFNSIAFGSSLLILNYSKYLGSKNPL